MARREQLKNFLKMKQFTPFEWGVNDCCLFVVDWLKVLGYPDYAVNYRGGYKTKLEAARKIRDNKDYLVRNIPGKYFKPTNDPREGDVALGINGYNLGIVGAGFAYFMDGKTGTIQSVNKKLCKKFWRVL